MSERANDIKAARALVVRLAAEGDRAWRMCVPPLPDDSDMLLMRVIDYAAEAETIHRYPCVCRQPGCPDCDSTHPNYGKTRAETWARDRATPPPETPS